MIFIDESGDDGDLEKSAQDFFVVSAVFTSLELAKKENVKIRKILQYKNLDMKWRKLTRKQKIIFETYSKNISYKIDFVYTNKKENGDKYQDLLPTLLERNKLEGETVLYKGSHMVKMVSRIVQKIRRRKIKLIHREVNTEEMVGIEIADLWAGYEHYNLRNRQALDTLFL